MIIIVNIIIIIMQVCAPPIWSRYPGLVLLRWFFPPTLFGIIVVEVLRRIAEIRGHRHVPL